MDRIMSWIRKSGDVRVAEDKKWLNSLRFSVIGPHPSPPPLRQGREHPNSVAVYRISLPCRSGGGLGWGPMTAERRD